MLIFSRKVLIMMMCIFVCIFISQTYNLSADIGEYRGEFGSIAINFFQAGELETGLEELNDKKDSFPERKKGSFEYYIFRSEMEMLKGEMREIYNNDEAENNFTAALDYAEKALAIEETTRAKRLKTEGISRLFEYRSFFFIIRNQGQAGDLLDKIRKKEPENKHILFLEAMSYINAPSTFGGDDEKGKDILRDLAEGDNPIFQFLSYNKLASLAEDENTATEKLSEAEEIFPKSPLTGEIF